MKYANVDVSHHVERVTRAGIASKMITLSGTFGIALATNDESTERYSKLMSYFLIFVPLTPVVLGHGLNIYPILHQSHYLVI